MSAPVEFEPTEHSHRRYNPLTRTWVLVSPHRTKRPWQGAQETPNVEKRPSYDPKCYLCPGNERANGSKNDRYSSTFYFENDFAAVLPDDVAAPPETLFKLEPARGKCYVVCFDPDHSKTLAEMDVSSIVQVLETWKQLYIDVAQKHDWIRYVQIFENKGSAMGCSNPHPHCQAWSLGHIPTIAQTILDSLQAFAREHSDAKDGAPLSRTGNPHLLLSYAHAELNPQPSARVIFSNEHFVALVPYWAVWPFEVYILPYRRQILSVADLSDEERTAFADAMRRVACRYDNLFGTSFPYSAGLYQLPAYGREEYADVALLWQAWYPPLLRSAAVRKFAVGFEMLGELQRDLTPEQAAGRLRELSDSVHYKENL